MEFEGRDIKDIKVGDIIRWKSKNIEDIWAEYGEREPKFLQYISRVVSEGNRDSGKLYRVVGIRENLHCAYSNNGVPCDVPYGSDYEYELHEVGKDLEVIAGKEGKPLKKVVKMDFEELYGSRDFNGWSYPSAIISARSKEYTYDVLKV
jgi:hypothetical protein